MDGEAIRAAMALLVGRVEPVEQPGGGCGVRFAPIDLDGMLAAGIAPEVARRISGAPWWDEMIEDVAETPEYCDDDADAATVLEYARDVVREYVHKRL